MAYLARYSASAFRVVSSSSATSSIGGRNVGRNTLANAAAMSYYSGSGQRSTSAAAAVPSWGRSVSSTTTCPSSTSLASTMEAPTESVTALSHPSFDIISTDVVTEYGADCTLYRHKKSGAELLSVSTDDDNKCFGITFRTPPQDSTGVPHILEHSVLCGSRKYKTKDPFVQLLQGSLQTFLNAFTYPDRTCYVVASQNTKDFYNLINVYADAVFHPRAISDPMVHAQEGWHLELEKLEEPLTYKGGKFISLHAFWKTIHFLCTSYVV